MDLYSNYENIIAEILAPQNVDRRRQEYISYSIDQGNQREFVMARLKELFPKSYQTMRISDVAVMKKILDKKSVAYKEQPIRFFPFAQEDYENLYSTNMFNNIFAEMDRDYNRQGYLLLWVNKIDDLIYLYSVKGFQSYVKINPITGDLDLVALIYEKKENNIKNGTTTPIEIDLAIWTNTQHALISIIKERDKLKINQKEIPGNENGINGLGRIPFAFYSKRSGDELPFMNNLYLQSIDCNVILSDLHTAACLQGYGQLVFKKPQGLTIENIHTGMTTALDIPLIEGATVQADAYYINANPDLAGLERVAYKYMQSILSDNGITVNILSDSASSFNSGFERLLAEADVQNIVQSNQNIYSKIEQQVFEIINLYWGIDTKEKLTVSYPRPKVLISDKETLENVKTRLELGLITKKEALMILDPNLSEEKALEKLALIEKEKTEIVKNFLNNG